MKKLPPKHIAIIMDGNGRWAKFKGKIRTEGHKEGANVVRRITEFCSHTDGINYLTLYAFSTENWNRPKTEVEFLMKLLESYMTKELDTYMHNNVRFEAIGDMSRFSNKLNIAIEKLQNVTKNNTSLTQTLAINYGSKDEITRAVSRVISANQNITESNIENYLDSSILGIPMVDMLVRTGGEKRLSNYLLWQAAYAELFFSDTLWPDFCDSELARMVEEFKKRDRRYGGV